MKHIKFYSKILFLQILFFSESAEAQHALSIGLGGTNHANNKIYNKSQWDGFSKSYSPLLGYSWTSRAFNNFSVRTGLNIIYFETTWKYSKKHLDPETGYEYAATNLSDHRRLVSGIIPAHLNYNFGKFKIAAGPGLEFKLFYFDKYIDNSHFGGQNVGTDVIGSKRIGGFDFGFKPKLILSAFVSYNLSEHLELSIPVNIGKQIQTFHLTLSYSFKKNTT